MALNGDGSIFLGQMGTGLFSSANGDGSIFLAALRRKIDPSPSTRPARPASAVVVILAIIMRRQEDLVGHDGRAVQGAAHEYDMARRLREELIDRQRRVEILVDLRTRRVDGDTENRELGRSRRLEEAADDDRRLRAVPFH